MSTAMTDAQYWKVLDSVVHAEVRTGHLRWSVAQIARQAGVTRTLIYYYFGKSKLDLVMTAVKAIGERFLQLQENRMELTDAEDLRLVIVRARETLARAPHFREFYFRWRDQDSEIRAALKNLEQRFVMRLKKSRPDLEPSGRHVTFTLFFALVLMPELKEFVLEEILARHFDTFPTHLSKARDDRNSRMRL